MARSEPSSDRRFPVVGVGASAGGLEAFIQLLKALPEKTGMAFVLVQHLDPKHASRLGDLLAKATTMPVREPTDGLVMEADHVYVIAPDTALSLGAHDTLRVESRPAGRGPHLPIDHLFRSLAAQRGGGAIGVVLSGTGTDGTLGLLELKAAGGITFAQDEASAKFPGMPLAAVHAGCVDRVLAPDKIAAELIRVGQHPYLAPTADTSHQQAPTLGVDGDGAFPAVLALLGATTGVDFSAYRDTTIKRRIMRRMLLQGGADLSSYLERLRSDRSELDALYQDLLINVTRFFREPEVFETLKIRVFPQILKEGRADRSIRIWVPGCSTGQEAYSLAMALIEFLDDAPVRPTIQIFATDLSDAVSLHKARAGLYPAGIEAEVSPERLRRFFDKEDSHYRISKAVREIVLFARQNVAADPPFSRVDLVSCRNLLIYLGPDLQKRIVATFHYALNPGGFLVLGAAESVGAHTDLFSVVDQPHRIYARRSTGAPRAYPHFRSERAPSATADGAALTPPSGVPADFQREADRLAAATYMPPGVLIDDAFDILQFRGDTGPYLTPAPGAPSHNLLKMARDGLFVSVRAAVLECERSGAAVRKPDIRIRGDSVDRQIDLHVMPVQVARNSERCFLVLFEERARHSVAPVAADSTPVAETPDLQHLRQELDSTRDYLQSLLEQQEAANEELKSANEEVLSSNEELQSTNEELETAKEELQSVNEELTTVNEQLQHRNAELGRLNDDTANFIASSGMPMVVLGSDLRIRRFTPAAGRLLGLLAGDVGRPIVHLKSDVDLSSLEAMVTEVLATVQPQEREVQGPGGRAFQLRLRAYRTGDNRLDGVVLVLHDIDELRKMQTALQQERDYAENIVETVREPLLVLDRDLRVRSANAAFYDVFMVTPETTRGRLVYELGNRQWDIPSLRHVLEEVLAHNDAFADFEVRHDFESIGRKVMRLSGRRIARGKSQDDLILVAIEDRTDMALFDDLRTQNLERLLEDDRLKTEFLAMLAHELRNPLAPLRNALHILDRPESSPEIARRMRATMDRQLQQLTRLVDDLLDVARINRGQLEVQRQPIELVPLVESSIEAVRPACESKGIELEVSLTDASLVVDADATRLSQAIGNVLHNACKFTHEGGRIAVTLEREAGDAVIRVSDTGIGISADQLTRVFDLFVQLDARVERSHGGLGVGLTLVKRLLEAHGGSVEITSEGLGHGSQVTMRLPLSEQVVGWPSRRAPAEHKATSTSAPLRTLVVDDNVDAAETLAMTLQAHGHQVRTANDGPTALKVAATWHPQVVVLDIGMPVMNGYEVARRIREQPWGRTTRLIALTGWGQEGDRGRSREAGFEAHLVKPGNVEQLLALLARAPGDGLA